MPDPVVTRRGLIAGGAGLAVTSTALMASARAAGANGNGGSLSADDILAIQQLKSSYALASDSFAAGRGDEGRARYHNVFTSKAHLTGGFPGKDLVFDLEGPDELADYVEKGYADPATAAVATQHLIGSIEVLPAPATSRRGRSGATITAYVQATVILPDGAIQRVLATYHDRAEHTNQGWRIAESYAEYVHVEVVPPATTP